MIAEIDAGIARSWSGEACLDLVQNGSKGMIIMAAHDTLARSFRNAALWDGRGRWLTLDSVDRQPANGGLFILCLHVSAGVAHRRDDAVQRDVMFARAM